MFVFICAPGVKEAKFDSCISLQRVHRARTLPEGDSGSLVIVVGGATEQIWFRQEILF